MRLSGFTLLRLLLLGLAAALLWMGHHDRWSWSSWQVPTQYGGDSLGILARIQAAGEGTGVPLQRQLVERLGAPWGASFNDFPAPDKLLILFLGQISRWWGVGVAANLGLVLAQVLAVCSFYGCARLLRIRREWAAAGALLFACNYGVFARGLGHMLLVFNWTLPPGLVVCAWVAGRTRLPFTSGRGVLCLAAAFVLGVSNPYNLFFWLQLAGWAVIAQLLGARRRENVMVGVASIAIALAAFVAMHAEVWLYPTDSGASELIERTYGGTEIYALKPIELAIPPVGHRWAPLAFFGHRYIRWSEWHGEVLMPYLGIVGVLGLVWLASVAVVRALRGRRMPAPALQVTWLMAVASVGGVANVLAFFLGVQVFRATNRVSFVLAAIVLLFGARQLSVFTRRWGIWARGGIASAIAIFGLLDQIPRAPSTEEVQRVATTFKADRAFGAELEQELGAGGMVFQLPVFDFPEVPPRYQLSNYDHFRLFLSTATLRFSFGELKGRSTGEWQRELADLSPSEIVRRLESYGFSGLTVSRAGYPDRAAGLLGTLSALGYQELTDFDGDRVVLRLQPVDAPRLPVATRLTFGENWHRRAQSEPDGRLVRWSFGPAVMNHFNSTGAPLRARLHVEIQGAGRREFELQLNGAAIHRTELDDDLVRLPPLEITLPPGSNRFDFLSPNPPVRFDQRSYGLRSLGVTEVWLDWQDPGGTSSAAPSSPE